MKDLSFQCVEKFQLATPSKFARFRGSQRPVGQGCRWRHCLPASDFCSVYVIVGDGEHLFVYFRRCFFSVTRKS